MMRTTVTLNDSVYRALKLRAAQADESVSHLIETALVNQLLEDAEDLEDADKRSSESVHSFEDLVNQFRAEGVL